MQTQREGDVETAARQCEARASPVAGPKEHTSARQQAEIVPFYSRDLVDQTSLLDGSHWGCISKDADGHLDKIMVKRSIRWKPLNWPFLSRRVVTTKERLQLSSGKVVGYC